MRAFFSLRARQVAIVRRRERPEILKRSVKAGQVHDWAILADIGMLLRVSNKTQRKMCQGSAR